MHDAEGASGIPDAVRHHSARGTVRGARFRSYTVDVGTDPIAAMRDEAGAFIGVAHHS